MFQILWDKTMKTKVKDEEPMGIGGKHMLKTLLSSLFKFSNGQEGTKAQSGHYRDSKTT